MLLGSMPLAKSANILYEKDDKAQPSCIKLLTTFALYEKINTFELWQEFFNLT